MVVELKLTDLNGTNGFSIQSTVDAEEAPVSSLSHAGDVNGDGFADIIVGISDAGEMITGEYGYSYLDGRGESYVIFGSDAGFEAEFKLADLDGSNGFVLKGIDPSDRAGRSVSGAGDVNGDGFDDLIVGAPGAGESYLVFGNSSGFDASLNLADLDGSNGFVLRGVDNYDTAGRSVTGAGDFNGDGFADIIIGAPAAGETIFFPRRQNYGSNRSGESYVVFGGAGGFGASVNLADLNGSNGFVIKGVDRFDESGSALSSAGDINGDGFDDVIIGARNAGDTTNNYFLGYSDRRGESYVLFGSAGDFNASVNLADLDGSNGFAISGVARYDNSGFSVSGAGDVNGDGFDDLIIGAPFAGESAGESNPYLTDDRGESYVVFGGGAGFDARLNLGDLDGSNGFVISGIAPSVSQSGLGDNVGYSVSGAGDINGDGFDDLIIGAPAAGETLIDSYGYASSNKQGRSYVIFGSGTGFDARLSLNDLDDGSGFVIEGVEDGERLGRSVSDAGDINDDGIDDIVISGNSAFVAFGLASGAIGDNIKGDNSSNVLTGSIGDDSIAGLGGSDTLDGLAGDDSLSGGNGNDEIAAGDGNDTVAGDRGRDEIFGGEGDDSLDGGGGKDTIFAEAGHDTVMGGSGGDSLDGGEGNDAMSGGTGDDEILAGAGDDTVAGDNGRDEIFGGDGNDWLDGGTGSDSIFAEAGDDTVTGGDGRDTLSGGEGNDQMSGASGRDVMSGDGGDDILAGGKDRDTLTGGFGNDMLYGEGGRDRLVGVDPLHTGDGIGYGAGEVDTLTGGADRDTFVLGDATGVFYDDGDDLSSGASDFALVTDFQVKRDFVQLYGSAALYRLEFANADATLLFSPNDAAVGEVIAVFQSVPADLTLGDSAFSFV